MDTVSASQRSAIMSRVHSRDTKPEVFVRRIVYAMGYRYRLHAVDLPGKPDLVFRSRRKVIFIHGCFWHRHSGCAHARLPKSRLEFWVPKLEANRRRDMKNEHSLQAANWGVLIIWECELGETKKLEYKIKEFLDA